MKEYDRITHELQTIADAFDLGPIRRWHMRTDWYQVETPNGFFALWPSDVEPDDSEHSLRRLVLGDYYANTSFPRQDGSRLRFDIEGNSQLVTRPDGRSVLEHDLSSRQRPSGPYFVVYRLGWSRAEP
jgi:hypothetical protein